MHKIIAPFGIKSVGEAGMFSGYASVFDVIDSDNDIVTHGAFSSSLINNADVKLLWQHDVREPIGIFNSIYEDERGLYVEGKLLLEVQRGREAYHLLKSGAINGLSIGYRTNNYTIDESTGCRMLHELDLLEVSLVTFPSNPEATIRQVKSTPASIREFEHFLRDAGFSRNQAKRISLHGFRSSATDELGQALDAAIEVLSF